MVHRFKLLSAVGLFSILSTSVFADTAAQLKAYLSSLDTVSSRFSQRLLDERGNLLEETSGTVLIDRPGRFRFDYVDPPQTIVSDGTKVWIYDQDLAQVTIRSIDDALTATPMALLTSDQSIGEGFRIEALDPAGGFDWFNLEPKTKDAPFMRIRLAFADGEMRRMQLVDQFDQTSFFTFDRTQRNSKITGETFTFVPPAGVDIIDASR